VSGFLLDTNVLSEIRKGRRGDAGVRDWIGHAVPDELFLSVMVLGEIRKGIEQIRPRDESQAMILDAWLQTLATTFSDRLLPVDQRVANEWGRLVVKQGVPLLDALIAATALTHELIVVSRDVEGFRKTGARILNPFTG
jgi:predicted nucleic acid-binding protein